MGGSIGIAVLTTMLEKFSLIHRGQLVENLTPLSVPFQQRSLLANFAMNPQTPNIQIASQKALGIFDGIISLQSSVLASIDIFQTLSWMFLLTLPLIFLLSRGGVKPGGAH
jgi:DHA2 family multidrug resistance protein